MSCVDDRLQGVLAIHGFMRDDEMFVTQRALLSLRGLAEERSLYVLFSSDVDTGKAVAASGQRASPLE